MKAILVAIVAGAVLSCARTPEPPKPIVASPRVEAATPNKRIDLSVAPGQVVLAVHLDARAMRHTALFAKLLARMEAGIPEAGSVLTDLQSKCGKGPLELIDEAVWVLYANEKGEPDNDNWFLSARLNTMPDRDVLCAKWLLSSEGPPNADGRMIVGGKGRSTHAMLLGRVISVAPEKVMDRAVASLTKLDERVFANASSDENGTFLRAWGDTTGARNGTVSFSAVAFANSRSAGIRGEGVVGDELAGSIHAFSDELSRLKIRLETGGASPSPEQALRPILNDYRLDPPRKRSDGRYDVSGSFRVDGDDQQQTDVIVALETIIQSVVVNGIANVIVFSQNWNEVRSVIRSLGSSLKVYAETEKRCGKQMCKNGLPASAPSVPAATPKGTAVQTATSDWGHPTWKLLHWRIEQPQHFRYEINTARDRKSVEILAHGDLNGDGKDSSFSLRGVLNADGVLVFGAIEETAPIE